MLFYLYSKGNICLKLAHGIKRRFADVSAWDSNPLVFSARTDFSNSFSLHLYNTILYIECQHFFYKTFLIGARARRGSLLAAIVVCIITFKNRVQSFVRHSTAAVLFAIGARKIASRAIKVFHSSALLYILVFSTMWKACSISCSVSYSPSTMLEPSLTAQTISNANSKSIFLFLLYLYVYIIYYRNSFCLLTNCTKFRPGFCAN